MIAGAGWCTTAGHKLMSTITGHVQRVLGHAVDTAAAGRGIELVAHTVGLYSQLDGRILNSINTEACWLKCGVVMVVIGTVGCIVNYLQPTLTWISKDTLRQVETLVNLDLCRGNEGEVLGFVGAERQMFV